MQVVTLAPDLHCDRYVANRLKEEVSKMENRCASREELRLFRDVLQVFSQMKNPDPSGRVSYGTARKMLNKLWWKAKKLAYPENVRTKLQRNKKVCNTDSICPH